MSKRKSEIDLADLDAYPVWRFDTDTDSYEPLEDLDTRIDSIDELHFRATFTSRTGHVFEGSIAGEGATAMAIFKNGRWYALNKAWRQISLEQLSALLEDGGCAGVELPEKLLPFQFKTTINTDPYVDWSGEFDLKREEPIDPA
mgnify:CR=1 FL=1